MMTTPNSYLDDFMDKMITVPNDINRLLRLIRKLDKRVQELTALLIPQQAKFFAQLRELKDKRITELPPQLKIQFESISKKQKDIYGFSKEKKEIADQLSNQANELRDHLLGELKSKYKERPEQEIMRRRKMKIDASKLTLPNKREDVEYNLKDPQYCYCGRHSFGQMVACENPYCEREWFHTVCLQEKNLPQKWYCADCQRQRDKTKNPNSRTYFVNKES